MFQSTTPRTPRRWNLCTACEQPLNADASSLTSQRRDDTELLHQVEQRRDAPVLGDLAVDDPHGVDGVETDLLPGGRDTEELSLVGAVIGLVGRHEVAGGHLPVDLGAKVGERGTQALVQHSYPVLVGCRPRLRRVVDKIIGEQLLVQVPVAFALYFLCVLANYGDRRVAHC